MAKMFPRERVSVSFTEAASDGLGHTSGSGSEHSAAHAAAPG
jgi:hypothetical protein